MEHLYTVLAREGSAISMLDQMQTRAELYRTIGYEEYEALDETIARSIVPPDLRDK
jgi:methylisocitrate lyase